MNPSSSSSASASASASASGSADDFRPAVFPPFYFDMPPFFTPLSQKVTERPPVNRVAQETYPKLNLGSIYGPIGTQPPTTVPDTKIEWSDGIARPDIDFDFFEEDDDDDDDHALLEDTFPDYNLKRMMDYWELKRTVRQHCRTKAYCFQLELNNRLAMISEEASSNDDDEIVMNDSLLAWMDDKNEVESQDEVGGQEKVGGQSEVVANGQP